MIRIGDIVRSVESYNCGLGLIINKKKIFASTGEFLCEQLTVLHLCDDVIYYAYTPFMLWEKVQ